MIKISSWKLFCPSYSSATFFLYHSNEVVNLSRFKKRLSTEDGVKYTEIYLLWKKRVSADFFKSGKIYNFITMIQKKVAEE